MDGLTRDVATVGTAQQFDHGGDIADFGEAAERDLFHVEGQRCCAYRVDGAGGDAIDVDIVRGEFISQRTRQAGQPGLRRSGRRAMPER